MQAGRVRLVEHEEVIAGDWNGGLSWDSMGAHNCNGKSVGANDCSSSQGSSQGGSHANRGCWELVLAGTGTMLSADAVQGAVTPVCAHCQPKKASLRRAHHQGSMAAEEGEVPLGSCTLSFQHNAPVHHFKGEVRLCVRGGGSVLLSIDTQGGSSCIT